MEQSEQVIAALVGADQLREHYLTVLQRLESVASDGVADSFSLIIGEANDVFAGLWGQLDHARGLLATAGEDVAAYDAVRATRAGSIHLGVLDSTSSTALVAGALVTGTVATRTELAATPNVEGLAAADQANTALKALLPGVAWAVEAAAREHPDLDLSPSSAKLIPWLIGGGIALAVILLIVLT